MSHDYKPGNKQGNDEEYATEIVPETVEDRDRDDVISMYGWIGVSLSVLSFLIWPLLLSVAGIIFGFISRTKGADTLGNIAIGIGVVALLVRFLI